MNDIQAQIRVLIVDDHQVVRQGLRTFLELQEDLQVIAEASDGHSAVSLTRDLLPDVILMDLVMPGMDGINAILQIKKFGLPTKIIALTSFVEDDKVFPAIQAGASSYLLKNVSPDELVEAVRAAYHGETRLHPDIARKLMEQVVQQGIPKPTKSAFHLTERETEVVRLVANGLSNHDIAESLVISEKTVKTHISNILSKLDLADRTQLAIFAIKNGFIQQ